MTTRVTKQTKEILMKETINPGMPKNNENYASMSPFSIRFDVYINMEQVGVYIPLLFKLPLIQKNVTIFLFLKMGSGLGFLLSLCR